MGGDRLRVHLREGCCSLYGSLELGSTGNYQTSGIKTQSAALINRSLMAWNTFWETNLFLLLKAPIAEGLRDAGEGTFCHEKANMASCSQQLLTVLSMERDLPGKEGNPHLLDFTDTEKSACQQGRHARSQIKQRHKSALISMPKLALNILINILIYIFKIQTTRLENEKKKIRE